MTKIVLKIKKVDSVDENLRAVYDNNGKRLYFYADLRSYEDFNDEVERGNNECAKFERYFETESGEKYAQWFDYETCETFITLIK